MDKVPVEYKNNFSAYELFYYLCDYGLPNYVQHFDNSIYIVKYYLILI